MKTHCINLTPHESLGFVNKRVSILWRPVEPQPPTWIDEFVPSASGDFLSRGPFIQDPDGFFNNGKPFSVRMSDKAYKCPYGKPGDVLIGREAWGYAGGDEYLYQMEIGSVGYKADAETDIRYAGGYIPGGKWRSAATMPRWAARHRHVIKSVSVKRCQDVTEQEASKSCEPIPVPGCGVDDQWCHGSCKRHGHCTYLAGGRKAFKAMIDARYPKAWGANLWMWRYEVVEVA